MIIETRRIRHKNSANLIVKLPLPDEEKTATHQKDQFNGTCSPTFYYFCMIIFFTIHNYEKNKS